VLLVGIPIWAIVWWVRYNAIETADPDFVRARKTVKIVGFVVGAIAVLSILVFITFFVVAFLAAMARH
jgi:hypothetical protein